MRALAATAAATVLALTASGCVTVHGETALLPAVTKDEAAQALADFTAAYNRADKAHDPALDAGRVTGPLGAINQAGLRSRAVTNPGGNPNHQPLELTDARFVVPRKAGWPRWFLADTDSNRDVDQGRADQRWVLAFVRNGPQQLWEVAHLVVLSPQAVPEFAEEEGYAVPVAADSDAFAVAPEDLGAQYVAYLQDGKPGPYTAGPHTSLWREERQKGAKRPGLATQYIDRVADQGDFAPLGLRTKDGGAFVFFATRYFERQTAAAGYRPKVGPDIKALLTGDVKNTVTKEWVSDQVVLVKPAGTDRDGVTVAGRLQGVVGAVGS
ncbi:putative lipoprotein [Streptomyces gardneri]|uniref:Putative lipoprotein n=1 Tax=Streptomyces gardneri TaxID=66892 RepID=A0A4Y3RUT2_9ACTN|nr:putative lipoprotein [Streptomyces gardneri]GHG93074.1 putative lipoprotein [Streptomyces gardneri]